MRRTAAGLLVAVAAALAVATPALADGPQTMTRHARLARVRWFVRFLAPDAKPLRLDAFDASGRRVSHWP